MPYPAADGRSTYQDPIDSEAYSKFYAFAHAIFTSCWSSEHCTMLAHWGLWDAWRWGPLDDIDNKPVYSTDHFTLFVSCASLYTTCLVHRANFLLFCDAGSQLEANGSFLRTCRLCAAFEI